MVISTQRLPNH